MIYPTIFVVYLSLLYFVIGYDKILNRYQMYFDKKYWTDYNTIEFCSWIAKAIIIVPGLIFGIEFVAAKFII